MSKITNDRLIRSATGQWASKC